MVLKDATREGRRGSREREESGKCTFFSLSLVHMRAQLCFRIISFPNLFYPMEIRHPSVNMYVYVHVCVHTCILLERIAYYVYRCNELVLCLLCVMYTRVNICVLRDNDFSGITL